MELDLCAICGEDYSKDIKHILKCNHSFHYSCLFQTFKNQLLFIQVHRSPITFSMINSIANWTLNISNSKSRDGHVKLYDKNFKKNIPYFIKDKRESIFKQINMKKQ